MVDFEFLDVIWVYGVMAEMTVNVTSVYDGVYNHRPYLQQRVS